MSKYYITNGDKYLSVNNNGQIIIGVPVSQAKRFRYENAYNTLPSITAKHDGWCVQKYYDSSTRKNYVITNASKFVGDNGTVVPYIIKARVFKTAADADGYIRAHGDLLIKMCGDPLIIDDEFQTVDIFGKKVMSMTSLKKINDDRKAEITKVKRTTLDKNARLAVYKKDNGICQICGKPLDVEHFTVDHIIPLERGGVNDISNYRCTCSRCNRWKSDSLDSELVTMLEDVGGNYLYKHPNSEMMMKFARMMVRGVINKGGLNTSCIR